MNQDRDKSAQLLSSIFKKDKEQQAQIIQKFSQEEISLRLSYLVSIFKHSPTFAYSLALTEKKQYWQLLRDQATPELIVDILSSSLAHPLNQEFAIYLWSDVQPLLKRGLKQNQVIKQCLKNLMSHYRANLLDQQCFLKALEIIDNDFQMGTTQMSKIKITQDKELKLLLGSFIQSRELNHLIRAPKIEEKKAIKI